MRAGSRRGLCGCFRVPLPSSEALEKLGPLSPGACPGHVAQMTDPESNPRPRHCNQGGTEPGRWMFQMRLPLFFTSSGRQGDGLVALSKGGSKGYACPRPWSSLPGRAWHGWALGRAVSVGAGGGGGGASRRHIYPELFLRREEQQPGDGVISRGSPWKRGVGGCSQRWAT